MALSGIFAVFLVQAGRQPAGRHQRTHAVCTTADDQRGTLDSCDRKRNLTASESAHDRTGVWLQPCPELGLHGSRQGVEEKVTGHSEPWWGKRTAPQHGWHCRQTRQRQRRASLRDPGPRQHGSKEQQGAWSELGRGYERE